MSVFDVSGDDYSALEERAQLNIAQQAEPEWGTAEKTATGAGMGLAKGAAKAGRFGMMLGGAAPVLYDKAKSTITGKDTTDATDSYFKNVVDDVGNNAADFWTPKAEHTNTAGEIIGGLAGGLFQLAATGGNPLLFGEMTGIDATIDMQREGVDLGTAAKVGAVTGAANALGAKLAPSYGSTLVNKLLSGAGINIGLGAAQRAATGEVLASGGYDKQAAQFDWTDPKAAAIDALMGVAFAGAPTVSAAMKKRFQDSVLTFSSGKHAAEDTAPGTPASLKSAGLHHKALSTAIEQIVKGEEVSVGEKIHDAEFNLRDELPHIAEMRGHLGELLHEEGRNTFAQQLLDHQGENQIYKSHEEARHVVDQFAAGIQKLHGAGVPLERLQQMRTSFGKPSEGGAVFNQHGADDAPAVHVPEDLEMTPEMEALFREHGIDIPAAGDSFKSTADGVDANGYRITSDADRSRYLQQFDTRTPASRALGAGESGSGEPQLPTGKPIAKNYSEGSQLLEKVRERSNNITKELRGSPEEPRRNAGAALGPFKGYGVDAKIVGERLHIKYYSDAQKAAGLHDEPALTVILNKTGELVINGPAADSPTFAEFQKRGWADYATKGDGTKSEFWTKLTNPDKSLTTDSMHNVLADAHARLRAWRKEDKVGINWQRYTGAAGHAQTGKKGVTFFQTAYHGSPHKFDKFSLDHMGKGEGAQAYGWGLYFAGNKEVAEYYRQALTQTYGLLDDSGNPVKMVTQDESTALAFVQANGHDFDKGIADLKEVAKTKPRFAAAVPIVEKWKAEGYSFGHEAGKEGQLYKVEIPEDDTYLLWDRPLSDAQAGAIRGKLLSNGKDVVDTLGNGATGADLYKRISQLLDGDEAASKFLHKHGISGIKYLDGNSRGAQKGDHNYVIFDDSAVQVLETYYQKGGDAFARNLTGNTADPQGQIRFGLDGEKLNAVISLFSTANKSTALHELSHNFLEIYSHLNKFDDTPASVKADYAEMRRLIGADDMGTPLTRENHERFSEAFEQYTREGKAPTPALKRAFEHFKEWMTAIYQRAADLGAPISDDMRIMFDTMLGKERKAEANHISPLLKRADVQEELRRQASQAGWHEEGGKVIMDESRAVTGRTEWIPKEEWYGAGMGTPEQVRKVVDKAIRGEKLGAKQQAMIQQMLDHPTHDAAREDAALESSLNKAAESPEEHAARMAEQDAFWDSIPEAAGTKDILNDAPDMQIMQEDGTMIRARDAMTAHQAELTEAEIMPKVYDAAVNCFLRG